MDINEKTLLLRYSDFHGVDTVSAHQKVVAEDDRCWCAIIGKQPSENTCPRLGDKKKLIACYIPQ